VNQLRVSDHHTKTCHDNGPLSSLKIPDVAPFKCRMMKRFLSVIAEIRATMMTFLLLFLLKMLLTELSKLPQKRSAIARRSNRC
jgi:hypothetical protein